MLPLEKGQDTEWNSIVLRLRQKKIPLMKDRRHYQSTVRHSILKNKKIIENKNISNLSLFYIYHSIIVINHRYHFHSQRELTQIIFPINESLYNFLLYPKHIL